MCDIICVISQCIMLHVMFYYFMALVYVILNKLFVNSKYRVAQKEWVHLNLWTNRYNNGVINTKLEHSKVTHIMNIFLIYRTYIFWIWCCVTSFFQRGNVWNGQCLWCPFVAMNKTHNVTPLKKLCHTTKKYMYDISTCRMKFIQRALDWTMSQHSNAHSCKCFEPFFASVRLSKVQNLQKNMCKTIYIQIKIWRCWSMIF